MDMQLVETQKAQRAVINCDEADELRQKARSFYGQMQSSWFLFARTIAEIRDTGAYKTFGKRSFREFCQDEFPSMHFSTIIKTIKVAEGWGKDLQVKLESETAYQLPAYEACYTLTNAERDIPKSEFEKLRQEVLEGKLSYHVLRGTLKNIINEKKKIALPEPEQEELEEELVKDIKEDEIEEIEVEEEGSEDTNGAENLKVKSLVTGLIARAEYVSEKIPLLEQMLESDPGLITEEIVDMANTLQIANDKLNDFLSKIEELSR